MRYKIAVRMAQTLLLIVGIELLSATNALGQPLASPRGEGIRANRIVVTPNGPKDGGDFGPHTPGTKTSGLQEAFDAAKAQAKDLYISGGSWTADKTKPVVYVLHETLKIPWMQDFRMESGHCVIQYAKKTGDAVVFDSQMSCYYRFGLIVSVSDGATVRFRPDTAGPDRFKVITSTEFHFNAVVGGGGAWPGGEAYKNELDKKRRWIGTGVWLDASPGPIDGNEFHFVEIVGCDRGLLLTGPCTHNRIQATTIHLCQTHLQVSDEKDPRSKDNHIETYLHSQGIEGAIGARIFGDHNLLTLSTSQMSPGGDIVFEPSATDNLITAIRLPNGVTNRAMRPTNRIVGTEPIGYRIATPPVPASGAEIVNRYPHVVEVRILAPGKVTQRTETDAAGNARTFPGGLHAGQTLSLEPGDKLQFQYAEPPQWIWKGLR